MSAAWTTILLAGVGTFAMRASFLAVAHRLVRVPPRAHRVLRQIPPAALAALVLPALVRPDGHIDLLQARFAAGVLAALVAWRTRSAVLTLVVGMGALLLIQAVAS
jgi:branched-subunit amino acid transport protein